MLQARVPSQTALQLGKCWTLIQTRLQAFSPDASLAQPPSWDRSPSPGVLPPYVSAQAPIGSHTSSESNSLVKPYGQNPPRPLSISSPAPPPFRPSLALQLTPQTQSHRHSIQDIVCCTALQVHREAIVLLEEFEHGSILRSKYLPYTITHKSQFTR